MIYRKLEMILELALNWVQNRRRRSEPYLSGGQLMIPIHDKKINRAISRYMKKQRGSA